MVKRTKGAREVGLLPVPGGVAEAAAVVTLDVPVGVDGIVELVPLGEEEDEWAEFLYVVGVDGEDHRSRIFGYSSSSVLVKVPGCTDLDRFHVEN